MANYGLVVNAKGQITIEYILIIVIALAILGSVTFPAVNDMTDAAKDTSMAVLLASAQQRIINTAEEVSMASCGSFKNIYIYIPPKYIQAPNVLWDKDYVWGNFANSSGDVNSIGKLGFPDYIKITGSCPSAVNNTFKVTITKDCTNSRPTASGGVGVDVCT
ncbi:MAG: hypothetical protein J7L23_00440 [Candidatus Diapherotrites archaeon]|nr:hypothetical protein [Candidatus Diapherotrites archaeon]